MNKSELIARNKSMRMLTGLPSDAGKWVHIASVLALPAMLLMRSHLGVRIVSIPKILFLALWLVIGGGAVSYIISKWLHVLPDDVFVPLWIFSLFILALALATRFTRTVMRHRGEKLHSLSLGYSRFQGVAYRVSPERYVDAPLISTLAAMQIWQQELIGFKLFGAFLIISAWSLYALEKWMHEKRHRANDDRLIAEAHQMQSMGAMLGERATVEQSSPHVLSTGIDDALAEKLALRGASDAAATRSSTKVQAELPFPRVTPERVNDRINSESGGAAHTATALDPAAEFRDESAPVVHRPPLGAGYSVAAATAIAVSFIGYQTWQTRPGAVVPSSQPPVTDVAAATTSRPNELVPSKASATEPAALRSDATEPTAPVAGNVTPPILTQPEEIFRQGKAFYYGEHGLPVDKKLALERYLEAAKGGYSPAQFMVGVMFEAGDGGLTASDRRAMDWYKKAALQHLPIAEVYLADLCRLGREVPRNLTCAVYWYNQAIQDKYEGNLDNYDKVIALARRGDPAAVEAFRVAEVSIPAEPITAPRQ